MILEGAVGILTGLIGNAFTAFFNLKTQKLKNEHEQTMVKLETEAMIAETQANIKVTEAKVQGELLTLEEANYGKNLELGNKSLVSSEMINKLFDSPWTAWLGSFLVFMMGVTDVLRGIMRPGLTLYLVGLTSWLTWYASDLLSGKEGLMDVLQAQAIFSEVVRIVIYLTVSAVTWWFADRQLAKRMYNRLDK